MHTAISCVLSCALTLPPSGLQDGTPAKRVEDLRAFVQRLGAGTCSGHVLIARRGEVLLAQGFGLAEREAARPWTASTVTDVGSITKQFTAAAIMKLAESGRLSPQDPLAKHLAGVPEDKQGITLHHLLTHTSGLHDVTRSGELRDEDWISRDDLVATVLEAPLDYPTGSRYEYSNTGFSFLAAIVELRSGRAYEEFVRDQLFAPLEMASTGYFARGVDRERLAVGYGRQGRWGTLMDDVYTPDGPSWVLLGNGGIHSTAEDMHRWALALLEDQVLSKSSLELLWTPHVDESNGANQSHYGYGWAIFTFGKTRVITHNGGNGIYFADLALVPDGGWVVFFSTNTRPACQGGEERVVEILRYLLEGEPLPGE